LPRSIAIERRTSRHDRSKTAGPGPRCLRPLRGSLLTLRWKEMDSNFQYAGAVNLFVAPFSDGTPPLRNRKFVRRPAGGTGFEPSVPLFERVLSALPNGDAGPIGWMGSLSPGRLARRRSLRADPFSTAVSLTAGPMVRIRLPPAASRANHRFLRAGAASAPARRPIFIPRQDSINDLDKRIQLRGHALSLPFG